MALPVFSSLESFKMTELISFGRKFIQLFAISCKVVVFLTSGAQPRVVLFVFEALKLMVPTSGTL
jgi:hypothetical protein